MSKQGFNIYKRKDGRWEARYPKGRSSQGKLIYQYYYGKSYKEAKRKLLEHKNITNEKNKEEKTICDYAVSWLNTIKPSVKESTYARYYQVVNTHIIPHFCHMTITSLPESTCSLFYSELITSGRIDGKGGLSAASADEILRIWKSILKYAKNRDHLEIQVDSIRTSCHKKKTIRILTEHEQKIFAQYLTQSLTPMNLGILVSMYTGLRIGEICALTWKDIDLENKTIKISKTLQRIRNIRDDSASTKEGRKTKIIVSSPKSDLSTRIIPIPDFLNMFLFRSQCQGSDYILTGKSQFMEPRTLQYHFNRISQALSINDIHFHALRHTFATRCIELGFDTKSLSEILGHSNINTTLALYVHPSLQQKRKNMEKIQLLFGTSE